VARYKHSSGRQRHGNAQHAARHIAVGLVSLQIVQNIALRIVQISQIASGAAPWPKWNTTPVRISSQSSSVMWVDQATGNDKCRMLTDESKLNTESNKETVSKVNRFVAGKQ
jgi:hypothetical protein